MSVYRVRYRYWLAWFSHGKKLPPEFIAERHRFDTPEEARASVNPHLLYGAGGTDDKCGFKVVRVLQRIK